MCRWYLSRVWFTSVKMLTTPLNCLKCTTLLSANFNSGTEDFVYAHGGFNNGWGANRAYMSGTRTIQWLFAILVFACLMAAAVWFLLDERTLR